MSPPTVAVLLVVTLGAAGLAWQECLLVVAAALAAQRLHVLRIEHAAALQTWCVGARCLVAGGAGLLGSMVLGAMLLAAVAGWWQPNHDRPLITVGMIAATGAVITIMQIRVDRLLSEGRLWLLAAFAAMIGSLVALIGGSIWACLVSGVGVAYLAWTSWQLAVAGASFLQTD